MLVGALAALLLAPLAARAQHEVATAKQAGNSDWLYVGSDIPRDTAWQAILASSYCLVLW